MRSTLQAKNAKTCKYFWGISPPDLNPMISNPSRNSLIDSPLQIQIRPSAAMAGAELSAAGAG